MAITRVSANSAAGTTATIGTHAAGDLILVHAYRDGSDTAPSMAAGFLSIHAAGGGNSNGSRLAYKWAASASESTGTWINATGVDVVVYRGVTRIGANSFGNGTGNSITYPALTLQDASGASWVVRAAGHRTATNMLTNTPAGSTHVTGVASECRVCDSNGGTGSNPAAATQSVNASSGWMARTLELRADIGVAADTFSDAFDGGSSTPDPAKWAVTGAGASVNTGTHELAINATATTTLTSVSPVDLTGKAVVFGPVSGLSGSGTFSSLYLYVGEEIAWTLNALNGTATPGVGSSLGTARAHSAGDWYQIRHSAGTIYFEYSTDGKTWSAQHSAPYAGPVSALDIRIQAAAVAATLACSIGGVNELPAAGLPLKYHNGTAWVPGVLKRHDGSNWVPAQLRAHNGTDWV